jgi:hypothetical protein
MNKRLTDFSRGKLALSDDPRARRRATIRKDQLNLALGGELDVVYGYSFILSDLEGEAAAVERHHRERAQIEERIRLARPPNWTTPQTNRASAIALPARHHRPLSAYPPSHSLPPPSTRRRNRRPHSPIHESRSEATTLEARGVRTSSERSSGALWRPTYLPESAGGRRAVKQRRSPANRPVDSRPFPDRRSAA